MEDSTMVETRKQTGIFPACPECDRGVLLPFSYKDDVFEKWKCSVCRFTVQKRD